MKLYKPTYYQEVEVGDLLMEDTSQRHMHLPDSAANFLLVIDKKPFDVYSIFTCLSLTDNSLYQMTNGVCLYFLLSKSSREEEI